MNYTIVLEPTIDGYQATVPDLPEVVAQGKTPEEAARKITASLQRITAQLQGQLSLFGGD